MPTPSATSCAVGRTARITFVGNHLRAKACPAHDGRMVSLSNSKFTISVLQSSTPAVLQEDADRIEVTPRAGGHARTAIEFARGMTIHRQRHGQVLIRYHFDYESVQIWRSAVHETPRHDPSARQPWQGFDGTPWAESVPRHVVPAPAEAGANS